MPSETLTVVAARVGTVDVNTTDSSSNTEFPVSQPVIITFSAPLNTSTVLDGVHLFDGSTVVPTSLAFLDSDATISIKPKDPLEHLTTYTLIAGENIESKEGEKFAGITFSFTTEATALTITSVNLGGTSLAGKIVDVPQTFSATISFSAPLNEQSLTSAITVSGRSPGTTSFALQSDKKTLTITTSNTLDHFNRYSINISPSIKGSAGEKFTGYNQIFYTAVDETPKFPTISDDALLTLTQSETFKYFWDFAHPASGMARERNTSGNLVTTGGSGFGIMAIIVGIERAFITRAEGIQRLDKILTFLEIADRFHGVWPHWMDGNTGNVIPFSPNDNGGDLVETAFLVQGLLAFREYLNPLDVAEQALIDRITVLWESVEWDWYTRGGQNVLYWHWSPDKDWIMNLPIRGWNEGLVIYVLAASSPTHPIDASVYSSGWANNGAIQNGTNYFGINLPLGSSFGGPLFFAHYSFLGIDPRNLTDTYANYWTQNVNHSLINHQHAVVNPNNFVGYSDQNWGLTASDNPAGYSAHSPTNDLGVITPTAALSSFPYTPTESMAALKFFYFTIGDKLWGDYGFYDAFSTTSGWYGTSYLAIDQGPIIVMIENYRTALLWDLFMADPEVQAGLTKLGFTY